jgi:site-specific DNA-cytosine methylase
MNKYTKLPGAYGRNFGSKGKLQKINGVCDTLQAAMGCGGGNAPLIEVNIMDNLRIRKLTPKECYRLMGFDDTDFEKAVEVNSNTQLYKQAGNSIVVNVLEYLFGNLKEAVPTAFE